MGGKNFFGGLNTGKQCPTCRSKKTRDMRHLDFIDGNIKWNWYCDNCGDYFR